MSFADAPWLQYVKEGSPEDLQFRKYGVLNFVITIDDCRSPFEFHLVDPADRPDRVMMDLSTFLSGAQMLRNQGDL